MTRNLHNRQLDHTENDLDTNIEIDGAIGAYLTGTVLHDVLTGMQAAINSGGGTPGSGGQVHVSSNDTTLGYLNGKLVAGTNITLTENGDGGNETLTVAATGGAANISSLAPYAYPLGWTFTTPPTNSTGLSAGQAMLIPIDVPAPMVVQSVTIRSLDTAFERTWEFRLYTDDGTSTLVGITGTDGTETFTPSAASNRTVNVSGVPVSINSGVIWIAIRNSHATNGFNLGSGSAGLTGPDHERRATTTIGTSLDTSSGWTALGGLLYVRLNGRVFGESAAY